jgi:hypothetical protein
VKWIVFSEQAKADIRAIPQPIAMNILTAIHRLAETGAGRVKALKARAARIACASGITVSALPRMSQQNPWERARKLSAAYR